MRRSTLTTSDKATERDRVKRVGVDREQTLASGERRIDSGPLGGDPSLPGRSRVVQNFQTCGDVIKLLARLADGFPSQVCHALPGFASWRSRVPSIPCALVLDSVRLIVSLKAVVLPGERCSAKQRCRAVPHPTTLPGPVCIWTRIRWRVSSWRRTWNPRQQPL